MELLNTRDAAKYLCISAESLMNEYRSGKLIGFKIGGLWRFDRRDLDAYISVRRDEATVAASVRQSHKEGDKKIVPFRKAGRGKPALDRVWTPGKKIQDFCAKQADAGSRR